METYKAETTVYQIQEIFKKLNVINIAVINDNELGFSVNLIEKCKALIDDCELLYHYLKQHPNNEMINKIQDVETKEIFKSALKGYFGEYKQVMIDLISVISKFNEVQPIETVLSELQYNEICKCFVDGLNFYELNYVLTYKKLPGNTKKGFWKDKPVDGYRFKEYFKLTVKDFNECFYMNKGKLSANHKPKGTQHGRIQKIMK